MKKSELLTELRKASAEELVAKAETYAEELVKLRIRASAGQGERSHLFSEIKRNLARVQTILTEKRNQAAV